MPILAFLNIGTFELVVVLVVAVMLFGGDLPDVARKTARMVGRMRAMAQDLGRELNRPDLGRHTGLRDVHDEIKDIDASVRGVARPAARPPLPSRDVTERGLDPAHEVARLHAESARAGETDGASTTAPDAAPREDRASRPPGTVPALPPDDDDDASEGDEADRP